MGSSAGLPEAGRPASRQASPIERRAWRSQELKFMAERQIGITAAAT
jgi:hypothetical protein